MCRKCGLVSMSVLNCMVWIEWLELGASDLFFLLPNFLFLADNR